MFTVTSQRQYHVTSLRVPPISALHLMTAFNRLLLPRRHPLSSPPPSLTLLLLPLPITRLLHPLPLLLLSSLPLPRKRRNSPILPPTLLLPRRIFPTIPLINIIIRHPLHPSILRIATRSDVFVLVIRFRVEGDDVPGVQQPRDVAEHAEEDVDEGVGGADAGFDPDWFCVLTCYGVEEDGEEGKEAVGGAHLAWITM